MPLTKIELNNITVFHELSVEFNNGINVCLLYTSQAVLPVRPKCFPIKWTLLIPNIKTNLLFRP